MSTLLKMMMENAGIGALAVRAPDDGGGSGGADADTGSPPPGDASDAAATGSTALGGEAAAQAGEPGGGASDIPSLADALYGDKGGATPEATNKDGTPEEEKKPSEDGEKKDGDEGKAKEDDKSDEDKPEAIKPEDYDLTAPEGFELNSEVETAFRQFASERGWSKEDVSALKDMQVKLYEKQTEAHAETVADWGKQLKTDKEIGGNNYDANIGKAVAFRDQFFEPGARAILDKTGLGNHPEIVRGFVRAGIAMGEAGVVTAGSGGNRKGYAEILYGEDG